MSKVSNSEAADGNWMGDQSAPAMPSPPSASAENKHFTPMECRGTLVYLGRSGGFDVRDCPEPEALAAFIVAACNAYVRSAAPVAQGQAPQPVYQWRTRGAEAWTDMSLADADLTRMNPVFEVRTLYTAPIPAPAQQPEPTNQEGLPDQNEFERQAAYQGARNFTLALGMKCANGWLPATYACPETELAWRVWANKGSKSSALAPTPAPSGPQDEREEILRFREFIVRCDPGCMIQPWDAWRARAALAAKHGDQP